MANKPGLIIFLAILAICILLVIIFIIRDHINRLKAHELSQCTDIFIENRLSHVIFVDGIQGAGKTTGSSGIVHSIVRTIINKGSDKIATFREYFYKLDFNKIDKFINDSYDFCLSKNYDPYSYITSLVLKEFPELINMEHNTYLEVIKAEEMINDYVMAMIRLNENHFVMSNVKFLNRNTNNYALVYESKYLQIKNQFLNKEFYLTNYLCIFEDERSLNNYLASDYREVAKEDTGTKEILRLFRNAFKGTSYYICTNQHTLRNVKEERELGTCYIRMEYLEVIGNHPTLTKLYGLLKNINNKLMHLFAFFHFKNKDLYLNKYNRFKSLNYFYLNKTSKLFSRSYLKYHAKVYFDEKDIDKENTENKIHYIQFDFVFPTIECFGTLDTYFYSFLVDTLRNNAEYSFYSLAEMNSIIEASAKTDIANNILHKKGDKTFNSSSLSINDTEDVDVF